MKTGMLDVETSKLKLQLEAIHRSREEAIDKYEALRTEGRYCRQQVLQAVKYAVDIANAAIFKKEDSHGHNVAGVAAGGFTSTSIDVERGRVHRPLLLLSPRGQAAASNSPLRISTNRNLPLEGSFMGLGNFTKY